MFALFFSFALLFSSNAFGKVELLTDFDGTLNRDRGTNAAWITPWILKRVDHLHSIFQQAPNQGVQVELKDPDQISYYNSAHGTNFPLTQPARVTLVLPDTITVSYDEYRKIEGQIARDEGSLGDLHPVLLNFDPVYPDRALLTIPGYYRIFDLTFKYYRESTTENHRNYVLNDLQNAVVRSTVLEGDSSWMGLAMPIYRALKSSLKTAGNISIFTSRGNTIEDFWEMEDELERMGTIKYAKDVEGDHSTFYTFGRPESRIFGASLKEKKLDVAYNKALNMTRTAGEKHLEPDEDGNLQKTNTLIIAEDEPAYLEPIADMLLNMGSSVNGDQAKFVLLNCGSDSEVKAARFPYRYTVFMKGRRARPATDKEIAAWTTPVENRDCGEFLGVTK